MLIGADITPVLLTWDSFKSTTSFTCPDAGGYSCKPSISSHCVAQSRSRLICSGQAKNLNWITTY